MMQGGGGEVLYVPGSLVFDAMDPRVGRWGHRASVAHFGGTRRVQIRSTRVRKSWQCRGKGGGAQRVLGLCKGQ